ncbi:DUF2147 domain-containing protein [Granulicella tundricola]|uniref:DUF2147 domain-containing protein n=1 Tax=Granulicella tundricola TaxID=940615 RepID=UPI001E593225|nr:DUF2147 domain-containing protein [Granulicella tundricola]
MGAATLGAQAPDKTGVLGDWQEPGGGVLEVYKCGSQEICVKLRMLAADTPAKVDGHNPDPALRTQSLCDLRVGYEFKLTDPDHADGGKLYDPKSGKTYSGTMSTEGDKLRLRGYVGIKLFGRTEVWKRAGAFHGCLK